MDDSVMLALSSQTDIEKAKKIFEKENYHNFTVAQNNLELILSCEKKPTGILLIDMNFPYLDCISTLRYIADNKLAKIIMAVADDWEKIRLTINLEWIDVFVTKPIEARKIIPNLLVNLSQKARLEQLEREFVIAEEELRNQKLSGYALQLTMDKMGLSEEEAKRYLSGLAKMNNRDIREVYEIIYTVLCNKKSIIK